MKPLNQLWMLVLIILATALGCGHAQAHEVRPALIEIRQNGAGNFDLMWKRPVVGEYAVRLTPEISGGLFIQPPDTVETTSTYQLSIWRNVSVRPTIEGRIVRVNGLQETITDVMVIVERSDGTRFQTVLTPSAPSAVIKLSGPGGMAVPAYFKLGFTHILTGYDHLAFVLCLVLLVAKRSMLVKTVTAFTVAHSITLALAALGIFAPRPALVEALVALSILVAAAEVVRLHRGDQTALARHPWIMAFMFGLLHGCAFAGSLADVGLPQGAVVPALLMFNLGVEAGQLAFVAILLAIGLAKGLFGPALPVWSRWGVAFSTGALGAFWFFDRVQALFLNVS